MWVFFQFYFHLLHHPAYPVTVMPATAVDAAIAFSPAWVLVYFSLWVYVSLPGALQKGWWPLCWHGVSAWMLCVIGLTIYYFHPTTFVQPPVDWSTMPPGRILQSVDLAGNAFPSMHVAYALFACAWLQRELRQMQAPRWLHMANILWCLAIAYSTLATKQHVWWDVVAGTALGAVAGWGTVALGNALERRYPHDHGRAAAHCNLPERGDTP